MAEVGSATVDFPLNWVALPGRTGDIRQQPDRSK